MAAQDVIDQILEAKQIRLTCRAKQLLSLILDGLLNEPFHAVDFHLTPEEEVRVFQQPGEGNAFDPGGHCRTTGPTA